MKLEYRKMGLTEQQAERFTAAKDLLEKTLRRYEDEAGAVLRTCCPVHAMFYETLKQACSFTLNHGGEMVILRRTTYAELEERMSQAIKVLEAVIADVSGAKTQQDAHKAVEEDGFIKVNMPPPTMKN